MQNIFFSMFLRNIFKFPFFFKKKKVYYLIYLKKQYALSCEWLLPLTDGDRNLWEFVCFPFYSNIYLICKLFCNYNYNIVVTNYNYKKQNPLDCVGRTGHNLYFCKTIIRYFILVPLYIIANFSEVAYLCMVGRHT